MKSKEELFVTTVRIIPDLCIGCGYCVDECLLNILTISTVTGKAIVINPDMCNHCGKCIDICSTKAIKFKL